MITFTCSGCGHRLKVKNELAGKKGKCPGCGGPVQVPPVAAAGTPSPDTPSPQSAPAGLSNADLETLPPGGPVPSGAVSPELHDFLAPPEQPGELGRIAGYRVLKVLGSGGMGVVFEAEDLRLRRPVALKVMLPALAVSETSRQRFLREGQNAAGIVHEHVVTIFEVGEDRGVPFLAMQLLCGETLEERLKRQKQLPVADVLRIGREIAEGLEAAHRRGLIHRDVKPANIFLVSGGGMSGESSNSSPHYAPLTTHPSTKVKLLDFGLARAAGGDSRLTQLGAIIGTPAYMSPEQANSKPVDARSDLFSLGCVLYRMCTGTLPFKGRDTLATLSALALESPPPVARANPDVPAALSDLVMRLLAKDRGGRPPSAQAVVEALVAIASRPEAPVEVLDALPVGEPDDPPARRPAARSVKEVPPVEVVEDRPRPRRRPTLRGAPPQSGLWIGVPAGAALVAGLVVILLLIRGKRDGTLVLDVDQPAAEVFIDGEMVAISSLTEGEPARLSVARGQHELKVVKGGFEPHVQSFIMYSGGVEVIKVRLERKKDAGISAVPDAEPELVSRPPRLLPAPVQSPAEDPRVGVTRTATWEADRHTERISCLAFTADGRHALSAGADNMVVVFEADSAREVGALRWKPRQAGGDVLAVVDYLPRHVLAAAPDGVRVWDVPTGKLVRHYEPPGGPLTAAGFGANGLLALTSQGRKLGLCDTNTSQLVRGVEAPANTLAIALVPAGQQALTGGDGDYAVCLWDLKPLQVRHRLKGHTAPVTRVAISFDGRVGLSRGEDRTVRVWDLEIGRELRQLPTQGRPIAGIALSRDGRLAVTGGGDNSVRLWDVAAGKELHRFEGHTEPVLAVALSPDGRRVLSGGADKSVRLWDVPASVALPR